MTCLPVQETEEMQDPLEEDLANHSNLAAWRIWWAEEPGGRDWVTERAHTLMQLQGIFTKPF